VNEIDMDERFKVTNAESIAMSRFEQRTPEWFSSRQYRLTGSNFGSACGKNPWSSPAKLLQQMLWPDIFKGNAACDWGTAKEPVACERYEKETGAKVVHTGLVVPVAHGGIFGVSPDGIVVEGKKSVGCIEIKCPFSKRVYPSIPPMYMCQMQGIMGFLKLPWCDFVVWTPDDFSIERVPFDKPFFDDMVQEMKEFYHSKFIPRLELKEAGKLEYGEIDVIQEYTPRSPPPLFPSFDVVDTPPST
jgi:putative phage-type endonuclease